MPELPEVETTVVGLRHYVEKATITDSLFHRDKIRYPLDKAWIKKITGQKIVRVYRRAKIIVMQLENGYLLWHLGMTGSLRVSQPNEEKRQHDHVECQLDNGRILRFHDPRRFGYLKWFADETSMQASIAHYGIEPLSDAFSAEYLYKISRNKTQPIKNLIMNQEIVVGVGNIYACEALYSAEIRPQTSSGKISKPRYQRLVQAIKRILQKAIAQGGTTISDFENAEAKPGYFQQSLSVYGKTDSPCVQCKTPIKTIKLGGRNSFYCPSCQK